MLKLTDEVREDILRRLAEGESLRSACAANGVRHGAWTQSVRANEALASQYARARDEGIDSQAEEMHDLEQRVLSGELDPNAFRAAMDARKWRLARQAPKKYGDKVQQEISGGDKPVSISFKWKGQ
ncbi:MAG: hypothetical protein RBR38_10415 [Desulfomicrobium apsheronum]|nr:hypothetical protein [Desulfomicrobium apsheronum]